MRILVVEDEPTAATVLAKGLREHTYAVDIAADGDRAPVVVAFRAGRIDGSADGEMIEPVGVLDLELWTASGRRLGVLARMRDVLPGRYAFGLTGRSPHGKVLAEGSYVLRLRAYPVDGDDGAPPSTAEAVFTITR